MKNDFREFYDENYILHSAMSNLSEEELMHGEWLNKFRKYVDKIKTASGKWRYIYPEDLKRKAKDAAGHISKGVKGKMQEAGKKLNVAKGRINNAVSTAKRKVDTKLQNIERKRYKKKLTKDQWKNYEKIGDHLYISHTPNKYNSKSYMRFSNDPIFDRSRNYNKMLGEEMRRYDKTTKKEKQMNKLNKASSKSVQKKATKNAAVTRKNKTQRKLTNSKMRRMEYAR